MVDSFLFIGTTQRQPGGYVLIVALGDRKKMMPDVDQWGGVVFVIAVVLALVYINLPREHEDDEDDFPWV